MVLEMTGEKELRKFGITMAVALPALFGLFFPWLRGRNFPHWPWICAVGFGLCALLFPRILLIVQVPWMKLAHVLGYINTRIILGVIYFLVIVPLGFFM